jgi:hypothetical protein
VRMPLPVRWAITTAPSAVHAPPHSGIASRVSADSPYPTSATPLWRPRRSPITPLATRTSAATPW